MLSRTITQPRSQRNPHPDNRQKVIATCARVALLLLPRRCLCSATHAKRCATTPWREGAVECRVLVCRLTRARRHAPDCESVEPQSSSFFKKRSVVWVENEEMSYEGTPVKATPTSRRRMMLPTPQQSSRSSIEDTQWQTEMEVQRSSRNARERTVIARMEQYLDARDCMKLEIVGLEDLLLGCRS